MSILTVNLGEQGNISLPFDNIYVLSEDLKDPQKFILHTSYGVFSAYHHAQSSQALTELKLRFMPITGARTLTSYTSQYTHSHWEEYGIRPTCLNPEIITDVKSYCGTMIGIRPVVIAFDTKIETVYGIDIKKEEPRTEQLITIPEDTDTFMERLRRFPIGSSFFEASYDDFGSPNRIFLNASQAMVCPANAYDQSVIANANHREDAKSYLSTQERRIKAHVILGNNRIGLFDTPDEVRAKMEEALSEKTSKTPTAVKPSIRESRLG